MFKCFITCFLAIISLSAVANITIDQLYHSPSIKPNTDIPTRIESFSAQFLGCPYVLGALGEGKDAYYDTFPIFRTDAFDCETYVDTVLALALAHDPKSFEQGIRKIRYQNGDVSFIHRNHFTCVDWNQNNQKQGYLNDITPTFHDQNGRSVVMIARALIDKPGWYQHFSTDIIRVNHASPEEKNKRLVSLKQKGSRLPRTISRTPYVPLTALFNAQGQANPYLFNQIPNGAIIEIVRPNWNLKKQIGTRLNISHLGFAIQKDGVLMFRAATSTNHRVMDVPLIDYLRETLKSPTIKGINIQIVSSQHF